MLFGRNPATPYLFAFLGITQETAKDWEFGRLRDTYVSEDGSKIFIFTRNGNIEPEDQKAILDNLSKHPQFVRHFIDEFDSTYCTYEFNTPVQFLEQTKQIADMTDTTTPMQRFQKLLDDMQSGKKNNQVDHALNVGEQIIGGILGGQSKSVSNEDGSVEIIHFDHDKQKNVPYSSSEE